MNEQAAAQYLKTLAGFVCETRLEDLPPEVAERGRWIIADSIGAIVGGMQVDEMKAFATRHLEKRPKGKTSVLGTDIKAEPIDAALLNGTAGTWLEQDEGNIYAKGHPGIQVVPAAVALAQETGASGADLLLALILGYEASARISRACPMRLAFHPHGTYGTIGAAVAVGKLLGYRLDEMLTAINVSATLGLATSRGSIAEGVTVRNIYTGMSGFMGLLTDQMVKSGFTGESDGVGSVYGKSYADEFDRNLVIEGLGQFFLIGRSYFKIHACGRYIHSTQDLIEKAMAKRPSGRIDPEAVERIDFRSYYLASTLGRKAVKTSFDARFSVPFGVASLIYYGRAHFRNYDDEAVANKAIQGLLQRVNIEENPEYTKLYPTKQLCDMRLKLKDGTVIEEKGEYIKGENENPHSSDEMRGKFFDLTKEGWGRARAEKALDGFLAIQEVENVSAFIADCGI